MSGKICVFGDHLTFKEVVTMPAKKTILTNEQRAKNIREAAEKIGASNDPKVLDKALKKVAASKQNAGCR